jgi:hypothetical protein
MHRVWLLGAVGAALVFAAVPGVAQGAGAGGVTGARQGERQARA